MNNQISITIAILSLLIIILILLYLLFRRKKGHNNKPCHIKSVPEIQSNYRLLPGEVKLYYKIDDNCNFQTLFINPYKTKEARPFTILGRFTGERISKEEYKIKKIETKVYELLPEYAKRDGKLDNYKIIGLRQGKSNTRKDLTFIFTFVEDLNYTPVKEVDYIYGLKSGENAIILKTNANMYFKFEIGNIEEGTISKPSGGYECDGEATTGGG
jgi:hypothetical protein